MRPSSGKSAHLEPKEVTQHGVMPVDRRNNNARRQGGYLAMQIRDAESIELVTPVADDRDTIELNCYFKVLGRRHRNFKCFYLIYIFRERKVYSYRASNFSHVGLSRLAPMDIFWKPRYPGKNGRLNKLAAMNAMFRLADRLGTVED